ncbi:MAG: PEP-CTERM sorting domain-containing protein [Burkholderiales bacterium]|nr:PEP-CTERM sorting domain-containing protein [Burkholderiales bacterium]
MKLSWLAVATGLATALAAVPATAAPLWGSTVNYQYFVPSLVNPYGGASNGNYVVGAGVEVPHVLFGVGTMDITANQLIVDFSIATQFGFAPFNGFVLSDVLGAIDAITGVSIDPTTNMAGFDASRVSFSDDAIAVNWQGLSITPDTRMVLTLNFGAVPEPASWGLAGLALFGLAAASRRTGPVRAR